MGRPAVLDGSNLAFTERSRGGDPKMSNLVGARKTLEERGFDVTVVVDAALMHEIDDPDQLDALIEHGEIEQAPAGTDADYFVLEIADRRDAIVVSNDRFKDWSDRFPWIEERRVPFMIVDGRIELYEPALERARRD